MIRAKQMTAQFQLVAVCLCRLVAFSLRKPSRINREVRINSRNTQCSNGNEIGSNIMNFWPRHSGCGFLSCFRGAFPLHCARASCKMTEQELDKRLFKACKDGDIDAVRSIEAEGADPRGVRWNPWWYYAESPLHAACRWELDGICCFMLVKV